MNSQEMAIWSMAVGAIAAMTLARLADLAMRPSLSQVQGTAYHGTVLLLVLTLSGLAHSLWPALDDGMVHSAQVLSGPLCVGLSNLWIRRWLNAAQRDRVAAVALPLSALLLPAAGLSCLMLPRAQQIPAAAALSLLGGILTFWLTVRAWQRGDGLAPCMAAGCLLTLPALAGLHATAMGLPGIGLPLHAALATCAALSNGLTGFVLWRRDRDRWRSRHEGPAGQLDPVTQLHSGSEVVRRLVQAQHRRGRTGQDGAVLAILLFNVEAIASRAGAAGLNEVLIRVARRIQRQVGVVNPVGRYYDRCFVSLVESIESTAWLRTLGLRVATSLRRPIDLTAARGEMIKLDVGVGVVHLRGSDAAVEDILHEAQRMAEAARVMRSRAAILDPASGVAVPVEHAKLARRRHRHGQILVQAP
jgi:GGDEF domain-containing protein